MSEPAVSPLAVYSAPGKALLAGGYLVLFPEYSALSVALSSRMHAAVYAPEKQAASNASLELIVESPQFQSKWVYNSERENQSKNPFVEASYQVAQAYFGGTSVHGRIVIWSDAGFHSQEGADLDHYAGELNRFSFHGKPITEVPKTGLGSSAALVVVVVAAIARLAHELTESPLSSQQIHNLAQIAHCFAQKKVGSGFDVATAIYGSIKYSRFDPARVPQDLNPDVIRQAIDSRWNMQADPCNLPDHIRIIMGDVSQGSETPGMVKNVLAWKDANRNEAERLFTELNDANAGFARALSSNPADSEEIRAAISRVRANLQKLTKLSGVPIEPPEQTDLLDRASSVNGVLGGVVPGAGGNDAVCVLVDVSIDSIDSIMTRLREISGVTWINMALEAKGLQAEDPKLYML